jgi:dTDP-4-amino-4,6-dideoxygalactose transaminase
MAIHLEASYAGFHPGLRHTEAADRDVLMLPLYPDLSDAEQDYVLDRLAAHVQALAA